MLHDTRPTKMKFSRALNACFGCLVSMRDIRIFMTNANRYIFRWNHSQTKSTPSEHSLQEKEKGEEKEGEKTIHCLSVGLCALFAK